MRWYVRSEYVVRWDTDTMIRLNTPRHPKTAEDIFTTLLQSVRSENIR